MGLIVFLLFSNFSFCKTKSADEEYKGYFEQFYIEENPVPSISKEDESRGYIIFVRNFMKRIYPNTIPAKDEIKNSLYTISAPGEYTRPLTFGIYPLKEVRSLKVVIDDLKNSSGETIKKENVDVRFVKYLAQQVGRDYMNNFMVLPKTLEKVQEIDINKGRTRQVWITVKIPPDTKQGIYRGNIRLDSLNSIPASLDISIEVLPFKVTSPEKMLYCTMMVFDFQSFAACKSEIEIQNHKDWPRILKIYEDQREHGLNSIGIESSTNYNKDSDGNPFCGDLEAALMASKKLGFNKPVIFYFGPILKTARMSAAGAYKDYNASEHIPLAKKIASHYVKKCREKGYPGVIFMPVDEPVGSNLKPGDPIDVRLNIAKEMHKIMHTVPGVETFQTLNDKMEIESLEDVVDYFCFGGCGKKEFAEFVKRKGKKLGFYPFIFGSQTTCFPRFVFGFFPWAIDADFVTPWQSPVTDFGRPVDFLKKGNDFNAKRIDKIFGEDGNVVPTIQWESVRVGINDAKYIYKLETLIREAEKSKKSEILKVFNEAKELLNDIKSSISEKMYKTNFEYFSTAEQIPVEKWDEDKFEDNINKVIDYSLQLYNLLNK